MNSRGVGRTMSLAIMAGCTWIFGPVWGLIVAGVIAVAMIGIGICMAGRDDE